MIEVLFFMFIVFTWIHGFHAVTREDKLLFFMAARIPELDMFGRLEAELKEDKLIYLDQYIDDMNTKLKHPQINEKQIANITENWIAAMAARENLDEDYNRLQSSIDKKMNSKKWKFILAIAPAWSECKECMSSLWTIFFIIVFAFINLFGLEYTWLIVFAPICLAGITSLFSNLSNKEGLQDINRHLKEIADAQ